MTMNDVTGSADELAEIREELRAVARDLLGKAGAGPGSRAGTAPGSDAGTEPGWDQLAASGWLGLEIPDELGGAGVTLAEAAVIAEELGRAAVHTPYLGAAVLGTGALLAAVQSDERDALLAKAAAGEEIPVAVLSQDTGSLSQDTGLFSGDTAFRLTTHGVGPDQRHVLHGHASFQPDAAEASVLLVLAYRGTGDPGVTGNPGVTGDPGVTGNPGVTGDQGATGDPGVTGQQGDTFQPGSTRQPGEPVLVALRPNAPGLRITPQPVLDETRSLAKVGADGVEVPPAAVWQLAGDPHAAVRRLRDRAAVAVACDSLGVAAAMLDATVSYAKVREQFGRPIGSFQAVKHACADMLVAVTVARQLTAAAVAALAGPPASQDEQPAQAGKAASPDTNTGPNSSTGPNITTSPDSTAASMAKSYACAAAVDVVGKAMQLHGGVGYAAESGVPVYLKRAALNRELFGSPSAHRVRLAGRYGGGARKTDQLVD